MKLKPVNFVHKSVQFFGIKQTVSSYTTTKINTERFHLINGLSYIFRFQSAGQENRYTNTFTYFAAQFPVVRSAGASQFLNFQVRITTVEQDGINVRSCFNGFIH